MISRYGEPDSTPHKEGRVQNIVVNPILGILYKAFLGGQFLGYYPSRPNLPVVVSRAGVGVNWV